MTKIATIALGAAIVIGAGAFLATQNRAPSMSPLAPALAQDADADVELAPDMVLGAEDAPIELIEYASFTCPHCANFHDTVFGQLKTDYIDTGKVRFVHREVFFDRFGLWAGLVARCGGEMRYFGITDMVYSTQKEWIGDGQPETILDNLKGIGKKAGMSEEELTVCLEDKDLAASMIAAYQTNASADEVTGTPTLIINGEKYSNMSYEDLKDVLDGLL
ncbi:MAG: DsbA family protein [Maritimibacter sp.]